MTKSGLRSFWTRAAASSKPSLGVETLKAVVLAAGKGERLNPLTDTRPKHLIPIRGVPLLEWTLRGLSETVIDEVLV
ncbi:MAG: NTP transferase domain-containing protein, partial [Candidatus Bathyarchaeota archaeon]